ncbi:MAG: ANTAR domain-containing response regulator [Eubacteriales bacterium]
MTSGKIVRRVLVVSGGNQVHDYITEMLPPGEYSPVMHVTSAGEAKRLLISMEFDLLIINTPLSDELGTELALDFADGSMGILLLCKSDIYEQVCLRVEESGVLTLPKPVGKGMLYSAIKLLCAVNAKLARLEKKNRTLQEKMADIRVVNRAKWLLIENLGMTEKDAHYYVEKQAMDTRLSRREVAESIIRTYDK